MFSDSSSTASSSVTEVPEFISIPLVDSSSDSHSEKNFHCPFNVRLSEDMPEDIFQGYRGQLKLAIYINGGLLTVHIISGRNIHSVQRNHCSAYVKVSLVPDSGRQTRCKTEVVHGSSSPVFDEKFSFEMIAEDLSKRVFVSVWHRDSIRRECEFLGCMSFSVRNIFEKKKSVHGWYYLLIGDVGRQRHLQVKECRGIRRENTCLKTFSVPVRRGPEGGFGFSISGSGQVQVCRVNSFAMASGLRRDDIILQVNGQNVKGLSTDAVARIIRNISSSVVLEVQRPLVFDCLPNRGSRFASMRSKSKDRLESDGAPCLRSSSSMFRVNYGWLDGANEPRCSSSSCGSNSSSSREALVSVGAAPVEVSLSLETHGMLETVEEDGTLEIRNLTAAENTKPRKWKEEEEEDEEEEENSDDYMDSFKDEVSDADLPEVVQKLPTVPEKRVQRSRAVDKENDFCGNVTNSVGYEKDFSHRGVANTHWRNSLRMANEDPFTVDFSSLPRSFRKPNTDLVTHDRVLQNCTSGYRNTVSTTNLEFRDFSSSSAKTTAPQKLQGNFRRSSSLKCAIFPKLSKLKTVFKQKN